MATLFYGQEDHLADLQNPPAATRETTYDLSTPTGQQQQQAPAQAAKPQSETQGPQPLEPQASSQAPESGQLSIPEYNPSQIQGEYGKLYNPIQEKIQGGYGQLGQSIGAFNKAVGYPREWSTIGGEKTLESGLAPKATAADKAAARGLVTAGQDFTIPEFNLQTMPSLVEDLSGRNLDTYAGTKDLLGQYYTGLSRGELGGQSERFRRDPEFQNVSRGVEQAIHDYYNQYQQALGQSTALGTKRAKQEQGISEEAQKYLTGQQTGLLGGLETRVGEKKAEAEKRKKALAGVTDYASLLKIPEEYLGFKPGEAFKTEEEYLQAKNTYQGIMAKYPDIANMPAMVPGKTGHKTNALVFPAAWWKEHEKDHTPEEWRVIKEAARARQTELEQAGLSPFAELYGQEVGGLYAPKNELWQFGEFTANPLAAPTEAGETFTKPLLGNANQLFFRGAHADVLPVGFEGAKEWAPINLQQFMSMGPELEPTIANVASPEEQARYNAIQNALYGEGYAPFSADQAWTAPQIQANMPAYQNAEQLQQAQQAQNFADAMVEILKQQEVPSDPGILEDLARYLSDWKSHLEPVQATMEAMKTIAGEGGPLKLKKGKIPEVW